VWVNRGCLTGGLWRAFTAAADVAREMAREDIAPTLLFCLMINSLIYNEKHHQLWRCAIIMPVTAFRALSNGELEQSDLYRPITLAVGRAEHRVQCISIPLIIAQSVHSESP
jgi:hypothetical protein